VPAGERTVLGIPDGAHTHGCGGGLGTAVLMVVGAALAVKLAGPVAAAVAELLHELLITVVLLGLGAAGLAGLLAWRWRRYRPDAARATYPPKSVRAAAGKRRQQIHVRLRGVSAGDIAAILNRDSPR
jgi:hypothetical protein